MYQAITNNQEVTDNQEVKKQGVLKRVGTAVCEAIFNWLCQCEIGMSPCESRLFMYHSGLGCEEAASYHYFAQMKHYEEQI